MLARLICALSCSADPSPPSGSQFGQDAERKQVREETEATDRFIADSYARFGYQLVELPKVAVEERVAFVVDHLNEE